MKKILFINGHMNCGGVEKALLDILRHIDYQCYEVDLLLLEDKGDYLEAIPESVNVRLMSLQNTYGVWWKCLISCAMRRDWFSLKMRLVFLLCRFFGQSRLKLAKRILNLPRYDTVVAFRSGICTQIAAYAIDAEKKLTWWHHGEIIIERNEYEKAAKEFNQIVAVSAPCLKMLEEAFPALKDKMIVVPNMIDPVEIETLSRLEEVPQFMRETDDLLKIVTICRIAPEKHVENIIFSAEQLKNLGVRFIWIIVGDGPERSALENEIKKRSLGQEVCFVGKFVNPYPVLMRADIFVHPSYVESQGISVLEALSLHVPCVVTESLGPKEYLINGENAVVVERGSQALTDAIWRLNSDKDLYQHLRQNSICPQRFLPENIMKMIDHVL